MTVERLVVEADGGSRGNPGPAAYGAVVRDAATGRVLREVAEPIGRATNNVAEYRGLVAGLRAAHEIAPRARVEVRMDSKLVVEQMSGRWQIKHPDMRVLADQARSAFPPGAVRYVWVPRHRNTHADRLVNEALDDAAAGKPWRGSTVPESVVETVAEKEPDVTSALERQRPPREGPPPDPGPPTTFLLLRHASTALTAERRFSGSGGGDPVLVPLGEEQAARAAETVAAWRRAEDGAGVAAVLSSPLRRCVETAGIVAARLGLSVREDPAWRESDFGAWEGLTFGEAAQRWPVEFQAWRRDPDAAPPGGESFEAVARRIAVARDRAIARYPGQVVLVVSHVTPIKTLVRLALGAPFTSMFHIDLGPVSLAVVDVYRDGNGMLRSLTPPAPAPPV